MKRFYFEPFLTDGVIGFELKKIIAPLKLENVKNIYSGNTSYNLVIKHSENNSFKINALFFCQKCIFQQVFAKKL